MAYRGTVNRNFSASRNINRNANINRNVNVNRNVNRNVNVNRSYAYRNGRRGYWRNGVWIAAPAIAGATYGYVGSSCNYLYNQWQKTTSPSAPETKTSKRWRYFEGAAVRNDAVDTRADARKPDSDIAQAWNAWRETGFSREDASKHGALAHWLVEVGLRDEDADYDVGDTPGETG
jgi:hypothetical protein